MQEYLRDQFLDPLCLLVYINDLPDGVHSKIGIYADDTTAYSSIQTSNLLDLLEVTAELVDDLHCIVEGVKSGWYHLVQPRADCCVLITTESSLIPLKMNDIELPESASFLLLEFVFAPKLDWKLYVQSAAKQSSQRVGSLFQSQRYLPYT